MAESQRLIRRHMPVGGLTRLKELGLDPGRYGSCAESNGKDVRGCPYWGACRFDRKDWGGFKGDRPHNVGYIVRTHEGRKKTDHIACFGFVAALQARMIEGMTAALKGEKHEFIRIIGQEGDEIPVRRLVESDPEPGQPWNSPRPLVDKFERIRIPQFADPATADSLLEYEQALEKILGAAPEMQAQPDDVNLSDAVLKPEDKAALVEEKPKGVRAKA